MEDFEWLSLDEFYQLVKSHEKIVKADVDVKGHDKVSSGQVVHVRSYKQHRADPITPIVGVAGPVKHFNKPNDKNNLGGQPQPVVPAKAQKVACPHCSQENKPVPGHDTTEKFSYPHPKNPLEGKTDKQISLDDIAQVVHKYPYVHSDTARKVKEGVPRWKSLTPEQKEAHLKNSPFKHLNEDAQVALKREFEKIAKKKFGLIGEWLQLPRLEGYDVDTLAKDFTNRLIEEMEPYQRTREKHGYTKYGTKAYDQIKAKHGDVPLEFHQGADPNDINTGADLVKMARHRIDKWARRFLEKEAGFGKLLNNEDVKTQIRYKGKVYKLQHEVEKLQKKAGIDVGQPKVDTGMNYDLSELEKIADKTGFRIEKESAPDGSLQRISIFEDDPDSALSGFADEDKSSTPKELVDLEHGGKLSDVRDKLASLVNPSATTEDVPLKKYKDLEEHYNSQQFKLKTLHAERSKIQDKLDRESVPAEEHFKTLSEYASNAISGLDNLKEKGHDTNDITEVGFGINSALEYLESGDFKEAMQEIKGAKDALVRAKQAGIKGADVDNVNVMLIKMQADTEAYRNKKTMPSDKHKNMIEELESKLNDIDGDIIDQSHVVNNVSSELTHLKADPSVDKYIELKGKMIDYEKKLDEINPKAESHWQVALEKQNPEGDEIGNYSDDLAVKQYKQSLKEETKDDTDWDEIVPKNIDFDNEKDLTEAGDKMAQAVDKDPSGQFIFGGMGHKAGLVHVAASLANKFIEDNRVNGVIDNMLKEHPAKGEKVPDIYKNYEMLGDPDYHRWKKVHDLYSAAPDVVDHYAVKFSDYYPFPLGVADVYDKDNHELDDLRQAVKDTAKRKSATGFPVPKVFEWQYYYLLRYLGNHAVEEITKTNPAQRAIFDKIKELNKPFKKESQKTRYSPGKLRRGLERKMDVIFGNYAEDFPPQHIFPEWKHEKTDPKEWLKKITVNDDSEKSFAAIVGKLEKGGFRHVIMVDEKTND